MSRSFPMVRSPAFPAHTTEELLSLILGERLGGGVDRETYVCAWNPTAVIKVCIGEWDFQNVAEWHLWNNCPEDIRAWLAPCRRISRDGKVLIQERCEPCPSVMIPEKVPAFLIADLHAGNLGLFEGRVVCLDYGRHTAAAMAKNAKRLVPVEKLEGTLERRGW